MLWDQFIFALLRCKYIMSDKHKACISVILPGRVVVIVMVEGAVVVTAGVIVVISSPDVVV